MTKTVYRAPYAIPEIGAEPGDHIIVRPSRPRGSLCVVKRYGQRELAWLRSEGVLEDAVVLHTWSPGDAKARPSHLTILH